MAQGVINAFEVVQVQEQQGQHFLVALGQPEQKVQLFGEQPSVGEGGQAVVIRQLPQSILGFGDFLNGFVQFIVALG